MLLEPIIITIINLLNLQVVPEKVFLNYVMVMKGGNEGWLFIGRLKVGSLPRMISK